jgi:hypothetical protein
VPALRVRERRKWIELPDSMMRKEETSGAEWVDWERSSTLSFSISRTIFPGMSLLLATVQYPDLPGSRPTGTLVKISSLVMRWIYGCLIPMDQINKV